MCGDIPRLNECITVVENMKINLPDKTVHWHNSIKPFGMTTKVFIMSL